MQENELIQRVKRLKRGNRRWRLAAMTLLLVCLVLLLAAFDYPQPNLVKARSVEAQNFVLRDADGQIRARMALSEDEPRLTFFDEHGEVISSLPIEAGDEASAVRATGKQKARIRGPLTWYSVLTDAPSVPPQSAA